MRTDCEDLYSVKHPFCPNKVKYGPEKRQNRTLLSLVWSLLSSPEHEKHFHHVQEDD